METQVAEGTIDSMTAVIKHKRKNGVLIEINEIGLMAFMNFDHLSKKDKNAKPGDIIDITIWSVDPLSGKIFAKSSDEG